MPSDQKYYAVARGRIPGVYRQLDRCQTQVYRFAGNMYKKFKTEAEAIEFVKNYGVKTCNDLGSNVVSTELNSRKRKEPTDILASFSVSGNEQLTDLCPNKRPKLDNDDNSMEPTIVYTDGSSKNNNTKKNGKAKAGYGVFWGDSHPDNVSEALPSNVRQTSSRAEFTAILKAIEQGVAKGIPRMIVRTDIRMAIDWIRKWKKNGWKTKSKKDVKDRDIFEKIDDLTRSKIDVTIEHVPGHSGIYGNDQADKLAAIGAKKAMVSTTNSEQCEHDSEDPDASINEFLVQANMIAHIETLQQGEYCRTIEIYHEDLDSPSVSTANSEHHERDSKDRNAKEETDASDEESRHEYNSFDSFLKFIDRTIEDFLE